MRIRLTHMRMCGTALVHPLFRFAGKRVAATKFLKTISLHSRFLIHVSQFLLLVS